MGDVGTTSPLRFLLAGLAILTMALGTGCADADAPADLAVREGRGAALQAGRDQALVPADVLRDVDSVLVDDVGAHVATLVVDAHEVDVVVDALEDSALADEAPSKTCGASLHLTFLRAGTVVAGASVVCPNLPTPERVTVHFVRPSGTLSASPPLGGYTQMDTMAIRRILARAAR